jgi:hypothetical protein
MIANHCEPAAVRNGKRGVAGLVFLALLAACGCGYRVAGSGKAVQLPGNLHTISIPAFQNATTTYRVEQVLTQAVVREFEARTRYRVIAQDDGTADAVLRGIVTNASVSPLTYDNRVGVNSALVVVNMKVSLVDRNGKVLYDNPTYSFSSQYQISREPTSFFQEEGPAVDRLARTFARTLVANVLEGY